MATSSSKQVMIDRLIQHRDDPPLDEEQMNIKLKQWFTGQLLLYDRILCYEPFDFEKVHVEILKTINCPRKSLIVYLDNQGIVYLTEDKRNRKRVKNDAIL